MKLKCYFCPDPLDPEDRVWPSINGGPEPAHRLCLAKALAEGSTRPHIEPPPGFDPAAVPASPQWQAAQRAGQQSLPGVSP